MPKIVDHDAYREELVLRYFDIFAKRGYADVTMREIASTLGVSTGTLYHYFPTKKSILEHMFRIASRHDMSDVMGRVTDDHSVADRLRIFCDYIQEKESYFQDIVLLSIDHYRYADDSFDIIGEADKYYGEKVAQGLGLDDRYGFLFTVFFNGVVYHRLAFPDSPVSFQEHAHLFLDMMINYLKEHEKIEVDKNLTLENPGQ